MNDVFFERLEAVLAVERLDAFRQGEATAIVTLSRYLWNMSLCESLYSPLQMAEVALRNSIHTALTDQYSREDWYEESGVMLPWQEKLVDKALKKFARPDLPVSAGKIVAELHFGFWTGFFNKAHAKTGVPHSLVHPVFKYASKYDRNAKKLGLQWNRIRDLRNRVFHHERIIHWTDLPQRHTETIRAIGWISPELKEMAVALDRFNRIHSAGIEPWKERIRNHWPKEIDDE
jgi:hypothetical protein